MRIIKADESLDKGLQTIALSAGEILIVEPGETHTFIANSADYFHFVIHSPGLSGEQARPDKIVFPGA